MNKMEFHTWHGSYNTIEFILRYEIKDILSTNNHKPTIKFYLYQTCSSFSLINNIFAQ